VSATQAEKEELSLLLEEALPISMYTYQPLASVEATGVCILIGYSEVLLAATAS
jgi:hypothetical protein